MKDVRVELLKKGGYGWIIICVLIGIVLMVYGNINGEKEQKAIQTVSQFGSEDPSAYASFVEEKVREICMGIEGVGNVKVVVTLNGGYKTVYALNSQSSSSGYKNEIVLTGSGSSEKALVVGYEYPEIAGIGIVAESGDSPVIKQRIISLVSSAFNIGTNKIEVVGG